jgi:hypothetical protein
MKEKEERKAVEGEIDYMRSPLTIGTLKKHQMLGKSTGAG